MLIYAGGGQAFLPGRSFWNKCLWTKAGGGSELQLLSKISHLAKYPLMGSFKYLPAKRGTGQF